MTQGRISRPLPLLLLLCLLCACQPQSVQPDDDAFSISFVNHSGGELSALNVYFFDAAQGGPNTYAPASGAFAMSSIGTPGTALEPGETYPSMSFDRNSLPYLAGEDAPEEILLYFELDGAEAGRFSAPLEQLWGGTVQCQINGQGEFSAQLSS